MFTKLIQWVEKLDDPRGMQVGFALCIASAVIVISLIDAITLRFFLLGFFLLGF